MNRMNIINDGENIVGKTIDVIDYLKNIAIKDIKEIDLFDEETEDITIDWKFHSVHKTFEFFKDLVKDIIEEEIDSDTYIKVSSTPQDDCYYYRKLTEEEN